jgi:2-phospho-L-lactate/phosphoenolpyruvate guanylyltransferase
VTLDAFLVPLKAFDRAKVRLRADPALDVPALAKALAAAVVRSCAPVPVIVVTESTEVASFAERLGAEVWLSDALELNDALQRAYQGLEGRFGRVCIVPGDLSRPQGLGEFEPAEGVTIVTDHHGTGTNVLALPSGVDFRFHYGADSAQLHFAEAARLGIEAQLISRGPWTRDIDRPEDLETSPDSV